MLNHSSLDDGLFCGRREVAAADCGSDILVGRCLGAVLLLLRRGVELAHVQVGDGAAALRSQVGGVLQRQLEPLIDVSSCEEGALVDLGLGLGVLRWLGSRLLPRLHLPEGGEVCVSRLGEHSLRDVLAVLHGEEARAETAVVTGKGEGGY